MATRYDLPQLSALIVKHFNLEDLRALAFNLAVDYESLEGSGKRTKVMELIDYFNRREQIPDLLGEVRKERPQVPWDDVIRPQPDPAPTPNPPPHRPLIYQWPSEDASERLDLNFVRIPAGEFLMGSDPSKDKRARSDEQPQHLVNLEHDFCILRYPVTVAQFSAFVETAKYMTTAEKEGKAVAWTGLGWGQQVKGADWRHPRGPLTDVAEKADHPVTQMSWNDAEACCRWLTILLGQDIRLPTEEEWEKAARGPDGRIYPWGNALPDETRCNFNHKKGGDTTPVSQYPNGVTQDYGVYDMAGNVYEWTASAWSKGYEQAADRENPNAPDELQRVLRGGSWYDDAGLVRAAFRIPHHTTAKVENYGFRCVYIP